MNWKVKAALLKTFAAVPGGPSFYHWAKRTLGFLKPGIEEPLERADRLLKDLSDMGRDPWSMTFLEIGTGHLPVLPILLSLAGAKKVVTVDKYRRLDLPLTKKVLAAIVDKKTAILSQWKELGIPAPPSKRWEALARTVDSPREFFKEVGLEYLVPIDAGQTPLEAGSIDCHFSSNVLEHIDRGTLLRIFQEAKRLLKSDGLAVHQIDLCDHFSYADPSLHPASFLALSEKAWKAWAGNQFSYCNRMRPSDYLAIFREAGLAIKSQRIEPSPAIDAALKAGFQVDISFSAYPPEEIRAAKLDVVLSPGKR